MKRLLIIFALTLLSSLSARAQAPSAPTIAATPGHKRNHIQITFPSAANGVNIYRATTSGGQNYSSPVVTNWRLPYYEDKGLTNGTTYYYTAKAVLDSGPESVASTQVSSTPAQGTLPTMPASHAFALGYPVGSPTVVPVGDTILTPKYDTFGEEAALQHGLIMPKRHPTATIAGTVAVSNGGRAVTGTSTTFLADYRALGYVQIKDYTQTVTNAALSNVDSETWQISSTSLAIPSYSTAVLSGLDVVISGGSPAISPALTFNSATRVNATTVRFKASDLTAATGVTATLTLYYVHKIRFVYSDTSMDLDEAYVGTSASSTSHRPWGNDWPGILDRYLVAYSYYDIGVSLYHWYYRTGNPYFLQLAREASDSFYEYFVLHENDGGEHNGIPARHTNAVGLMMRAVDGKSTYWSAVATYLDGAWYIWVDRKIGDFYDTREQAYVMQYGAVFAYTNPDSATRATWKTKVEDGYLALWVAQQNKYADRVPRIDARELADHRIYYHYHQPWIDALWGEAAFMVIQLTGNATVKSKFLEYTSRLQDDYDYRLMTNGGGGVRGRFVRYSMWQSDAPNTDPVSVPSYSSPMDVKTPPEYAQMGDTEPVTHTEFNTDTYNKVASTRFANDITLTLFGYAYYLSGDVTYLQWGDERAKSAFGNESGMDDDGYSSYAVINNGKNFDEAYRRTGSYWAYRNLIATIGDPASMKFRGKVKLGGKVSTH